jgi:hypothetical protein
VQQIPFRPHQPHPQLILPDELFVSSCGGCDLHFLIFIQSLFQFETVEFRYFRYLIKTIRRDRPARKFVVIVYNAHLTSRIGHRLLI